MTLTTFEFNKWLDLPRYRGQRTERFRFQWINGLTNEPLGYVSPSRDGSPPTLSHDTSKSVKRRLSLSLGVDDTAEINPITDRILPFMEIGDDSWPLGRYMFTDDTGVRGSRGSRGSFVLVDEGFAIDQELEQAYGPTSVVQLAVIDLVSQVPFITTLIEPAGFFASGAFAAGATRGQALETYATQGDYFPYWMDHSGILRMIRTFDPAKQVVDVDYDENPRIRLGSLAETSDVLTAPNRFVVVSNGGDAATAAIVGTYDLPPTAPHSIAKRGFVVANTTTMQITTIEQAYAAARNQGIRQTVFERITFDTPIDPRHDSYTVIRWDGVNWLELNWAMQLVPGASMQHTARKAYA